MLPSATYTAAVHPSLGQNYAIAQHLLLPVHVIFTCVAVFNNAQKSFYIVARTATISTLTNETKNALT
jgi:hypothetical protein